MAQNFVKSGEAKNIREGYHMAVQYWFEQDRMMEAAKKGADALIRTSDNATGRFIASIQKSQTRLLAKMDALIAEAPDLSSVSVKARLKWYMDNAVSSAKMLKATGYTKAANEYLAQLKEIAEKASLASRAAAPVFTDVPKEFIQFMQQRSYEHLEFLGIEAIRKIDTTLLEMSIGGYTRGAMLEELKGIITGEYPWGDKTGLYEWHAGTYVRTASQRSAQLFMNYQAERYGLNKFMYSGPLDSKTREFCRRLLQSGEFYTKDEIKTMDNGQTQDVFTTCGGYNCRHKWVAVSDEIARAISRAA
jgi:FMN-dependent NADH-azoreductase